MNDILIAGDVLQEEGSKKMSKAYYGFQGKYLSKSLFYLVILVFGFVSTSAAKATVIGFEDLHTRDNFTDLGIVDTYQGFEWGYGSTAGAPIWVNAETGWASAPLTDPATSPPPVGVTGNSYAWNYNGPLSLWIDFKSEMTFESGYFSWLSLSHLFNSASIQAFGYDSTMSLVGFSSVLTLTDTMTLLVANLSGIQFLELRGSPSTINSRHWFAVDELSITSVTPVPLPAAFPLFMAGLAGLGLVGWRRKRRGEQVKQA